MSIEQEERLATLTERVDILEDGYKMYRSRQETLSKEVKVILAEIHIITEWIHQRFGVELLNKNSFLFKHIHDFEEVAEISATLCLLANVAGSAAKYTGAELAAAAAAAAAGNAAAAAAASQREDHCRGGYSSNSPVSPSPTGIQQVSHRMRMSSLSHHAEHPPRPISTPPMISGQQMSPYHHHHHQQHTLLIPQQGSPAPAHSNSSMHHPHHQQQHHHPSSSHHHSQHPHQPPPSPHHPHHSPPSTQEQRHYNMQHPPTSSASNVTIQHTQQYILPHNSPSTSPTAIKLSPQNTLCPPPPPPQPNNTSPNSPTNLNSQSQLIISKKSKPSHNQQQQAMISPPLAPPNKVHLPPPPPPVTSTSSMSASGKNQPIPVSVVTLNPPSSSPPSTHSSTFSYSSSSTTQAPMSQPVTVHIQSSQPPPPPITHTITHISVPPKKSLSSRNAHNLSNCSSGSANIKKYFKPLAVHEHQQSQSSSRSSSPPPMTVKQHQKPSSTTGTLVESHSTIGTVYIFSEPVDQEEPPPIINIDIKPLPTERMDTAADSNVQIRPSTPENTVVPTPEPEVLRPKRRNRKKGGYTGANKVTPTRLLNNDRGRSPNHNTNSLDYTADTEDEVPSSRDSTPVHTNKRKALSTPMKPLKTSTPITTTPKSSKQHHPSLRSSTPSTASRGADEGIIPGASPIPGPSHATTITTLNNRVSRSNSSSRDSSKHHQSGGEESSSTGTSEKLPKRGRPKKRPEERVRTYDPRVPMQCDECGKVLKGTGALRVHKQIHQNIRPYDCTVCGRAFRRKHHLEFHMMIHEGNKKETCSYCGKAFLIRRDLARHERTHTGEKPYSCHLCPKSFNVKQHLTLHIRTHTGERPYRCPICDKTFTQANSLRIHKKIHLRDRERAEGAGGTGNGGPGGGAGSGNPTGGGGKGGGKGKGGGGNRNNNNTANNNTNSTNSNASNSSNSSTGSGSSLGSSTTSGISSASTSALETPERIRPPSSGGGGSRVASPSPSLRSGQSSPPSPAVRQHPLLQQVHVPPVAETVTVVTSPPAHLSNHTFDQSRGGGGGGEMRGPDHSYNNGQPSGQPNQPGSPPRTWRLSLNPGSGTNLISPPGPNSGGAGSPQPNPPTFTIPAAHQVQPSTVGNPGHYAVIRNMVAAPVAGPTLVRAYIPSPESHHHNDGRSPPPSMIQNSGGNSMPAHHHNHMHGHHTQSPSSNQQTSAGPGGTTATFTIYDPNVTTYYN